VQTKKETISHIEYAGRKVESVRKLHRTSASIIDRGVQHPPRPLTKIIGGILTVDGFSKTETLKDKLKILEPLKSLDIGCAIKCGSFYVEYEGQEEPNNRAFQERVKELFEKNQLYEIQNIFEKRINDYYINREMNEIEFSLPENSLVSFFLQLSRYLQQSIGSVAAIDLGAYTKAIKFEIDEEL